MLASTDFIPSASLSAAAATGATVVDDPRWQVRLLGAVEAAGLGQTLSRWPSRAVAALLARLALAPDRAHPREELVELLWPGVGLDVGRNRLRQALSTLKSLLEPTGSRAAPVLLADRMSVRVLPGRIGCDVRQFEQHVRAGHRVRAHELYRGELMPGFYDDWVIEERNRLALHFERLEFVLAEDAGKTTSMLPPLAPHSPPKSDSAEMPPTGLPHYWTRPFGIERSASRLRARVCAQRLVTVHGPGGSGKTRLAVEMAQAMCDPQEQSNNGGNDVVRFDRIVFVPLAHCTRPGQVLEAIGTALREDRGGDIRARIVATLAGRRWLLVLDNLEQLVDSAGGEIAQLLSDVPTLHVLATSRRLLDVDGEHAFELNGLTLPAPDAGFDDAADNAAVALFVDRARASRSDFSLGMDNAATLSSLVQMLGGMPLAIELAASRMRNLTASELRSRLLDASGTPMLDLLARGTRHASVDARHASMRHVMAWSWQQLTSAQVTLLQVMSVFSAPACLDAVAAAAACDRGQTQSLLDDLGDASLVPASDAANDSTRYALLQPVREFAAENLPVADARTARQRLRRWLIAFAREAVVRGPAAVVPELVQVHAAIVSAPADGEPRQALELALALRPLWDTDHLPLSDLQALEKSLASVDDRDLRCDALELLAFGRGTAGFVADAVAHAEAALELAQDDRRRSLALVRWVWVMYYAGRYAAGLEPALTEALALAQRCGDLAAQATVLRMHGLVACNFHLDFARAEVISAQAQQLWERLGNRRMAYARLLDRATMWAWLGRNAEAITIFGECEQAARQDGDWVGLMQIAWQLGRVFIRMRRWTDAAVALRRSVRIGWQRHYAQGLANALLHLPEALVMSGQAQTAARLQGFAVTHWSRLYNAINRIEARELRRTRLLLRLALGAARAETLRAEGSGMALADAVALALGESRA